MARVPDYVKKAIQRSEELATNSGGGGGFLKIEKGIDNLARLVTYKNKSGEEWLNNEYRHHFVNGTIPCRKHFGDSECPLCEFADFLESKNLTELAGKMKSKNHFVFNVLDKDGKLTLLECGSMLSTAVMAIFADSECGDVAHPVTGRYLKLRKTGAGFDTTYTALPSLKASALPKGIKGRDLDKWLESKTLSADGMIKLIENTYNYDYSEISSGAKQAKEERGDANAPAVNEGTYSEAELGEKSKAELRTILKKEFDFDAPKSWVGAKLIKRIMNDGLPF